VRRSLAVKLTLLPMLASAAAAAQPAPSDEPPVQPPGATEPVQPPGATEPVQPPGATEPVLSPPGLTPGIDECSADPEDPRCPPLDECQTDPSDPPCPPPEEESPEAEGYGGYVHGIFGGPIRVRHHHHHHRGVFRGGFGHYFWASGG
jgi:hypothetical protein